MKQHISILFFVLLSSLSFTSEQLDQDATRDANERAIKPLVFQSYKNITIGYIRRGYEITVPGSYAITAPNVKIRTSDTPAVSGTTVLVNTVGVTNALIGISSSNVTLDLGGAHISTDNTGSYIGIVIADGVHNVTVRNGTITSDDQNFDNGIIVGQNCSNILIEDMVIQGCDHADGAVHIKGVTGAGNSSRNITLKNLNLSNNSTLGLKCSYCKNLTLENVQCNSNIIATNATTITSINLNNCKTVSGTNIEANNCSADEGTTALEINACYDVNLDNVSVTNNTDTDTTNSTTNYVKGVYIDSSFNVSLSNIEASNISRMIYAVGCIASTDVTIDYLDASNCTALSTTDSNAVYLSNCQNLAINHATISNNSATDQDFTVVSCVSATNKNILFNDVNLTNNSVTDTDGANVGTDYSLIGIEIENTESAELRDCTISQNTSTKDLHCLKISTSSTDILCDNVSIINNSSSSTQTGLTVRGMDINAVDGIELRNCTVNSNSGTGQAFGYYLTDLDYAIMNNCAAQGNAADTTPAEYKPSAGLYLLECSYCTVENSLFNNNQSNDHVTTSINADAAAGAIDAAATNVGAGIINIGTTNNIGNSFINCTCNNNMTQLTTAAGATEVDVGGGNYRYSTTNILAAGAVNQTAKNTTYKNCTFSFNGSNNNTVLSCGLLNVTSAKQTHLINCTANNNDYFGFADDGVFASGTTNAEIYCIGCLAISNGAENTIAEADTSVTDGHDRNCRAYYQANTSDTPPFLPLTFDDVSTDIGTNGSPYVNISIVETT